MENYQVLYRKYRPKTFDDVIGQEHITTTLSHEVMSGNFSHAYLFTGSRGTGKTTCAKIFAKAINCESPVNGNPCGKCETCKAIDSGKIADIVEMDAASNRGIDEVRALRDELNLAPTMCNWRVYIMDEVHMLTPQAFNALLKTLEEPPPHVKFILATTEVQKIPVTILSRCQRFDFNRVSSRDIQKRLKYVAEKENFDLDDDAAAMIANLADGGMRDALSLLDQCAKESTKITEETVYSTAGFVGREHLFKLADAFAGNNASDALSIINDLHNASFDMERLCSDLTGHFRNLMIAKELKDPKKVLNCTKKDLNDFIRQSENFSTARILNSIDLLNRTLINIKAKVNRRTEMEMAAIKLSGPELSQDLSKLIKRLEKLENAVNCGTGLPVQARSTAYQAEAAKPAASVKAAEPYRETEYKPHTANVSEQNQQANNANAFAPFDAWQQVLERLGETNKPLFAIFNGSTAFTRGDSIGIKCDNPSYLMFINTPSYREEILKTIFDITGKKYSLCFSQKQLKLAETAEPEQSSSDRFDELLQNAKAMNVEVNEK